MTKIIKLLFLITVFIEICLLTSCEIVTDEIQIMSSSNKPGIGFKIRLQTKSKYHLDDPFDIKIELGHLNQVRSPEVNYRDNIISYCAMVRLYDYNKINPLDYMEEFDDYKFSNVVKSLNIDYQDDAKNFVIYEENPFYTLSNNIDYKYDSTTHNYVYFDFMKSINYEIPKDKFNSEIGIISFTMNIGAYYIDGTFKNFQNAFDSVNIIYKVIDNYIYFYSDWDSSI